jgi:sugar transferase (PEP-CTERM system associated)
MRAIGTTSLILGIAYWLFPLLVVEKGVFLLTTVVAAVLLIAWRSMFKVISERIMPRERLLLVGTSPAAIVLARELFERRHELGVEIVGFVDTDASRVGAPVINPGVVGTLDDIPALTARLGVSRVVVSLSDQRGKLPMDRLLDVRLQSGVLFDHLASVYEEYTGKIALENLRPSWLIFSTGFRKTRLWLITKRACDIVAAVFGLVLSLPLAALTALLVKLDSPADPVFYHQERVGLNGATFTIHKFRTMRSDAEAHTGPVWSAGDSDPRITRVGHFLRKTRLDEVPQLWNVLRGDMSLIGPRPERPQFVEQLTKQIPFYGQRHVVKPGVTGWAQVRYTYGASVEDALEKMQYDLYYVKHLSLRFDLLIAVETVKIILLRRGAR